MSSEGFYEVKVFDAKGKLKKILKKSELKEEFWKTQLGDWRDRFQRLKKPPKILKESIEEPEDFLNE